jgi:hypothetical protein
MIVVENPFHGSSFLCEEVFNESTLRPYVPTETMDKSRYIARHSLLPCGLPDGLARALAKAWNEWVEANG